jgi:hypothetical protein
MGSVKVPGTAPDFALSITIPPFQEGQPENAEDHREERTGFRRIRHRSVRAAPAGGKPEHTVLGVKFRPFRGNFYNFGLTLNILLFIMLSLL